MRKKLLIIPSWYPSDLSPVNGVFIEDQVVVLSRDYDVMVYFPQMFGAGALLASRMKLGTHIEKRGCVHIWRERVFVPPRSFPFSITTTCYLRRTRRGFKKVLGMWGKPDLIHTHVVFPAGWAAMKLGLDYGIQVVLTEHTGPFSAHLNSGARRRLVRETLTKVNRIIAVSPALAQEIQDFHPTARIDIVGNLIRTDFFKPSPDNSGIASVKPRMRFLTVALLHRGKGLSYLLEAAHLLTQRGIVNFELLIGGDGPDRPSLEKRASMMELSNRCRFLGVLTRPEVRSWMQNCDVLVMPSLRETFGVVLGEAMACGKPVISTRSGGPEFIVTPETGVLVNAGDPVGLADAMSGFIFGKFRFDASQIRQSIHQRFGEEAFIRNISAIYNQLWAKA